MWAKRELTSCWPSWDKRRRVSCGCSSRLASGRRFHGATGADLRSFSWQEQSFGLMMRPVTPVILGTKSTDREIWSHTLLCVCVQWFQPDEWLMKMLLPVLSLVRSGCDKSPTEDRFSHSLKNSLQSAVSTHPVSFPDVQMLVGVCHHGCLRGPDTQVWCRIKESFFLSSSSLSCVSAHLLCCWFIKTVKVQSSLSSAPADKLDGFCSRLSWCTSSLHSVTCWLGSLKVPASKNSFNKVEINACVSLWKVIKTLVWTVQASRCFASTISQGWSSSPPSVCPGGIANGWPYTKDKGFKMSRVWTTVARRDADAAYLPAISWKECNFWRNLSKKPKQISSEAILCHLLVKLSF